jgi:hypothetical protein
MAEMAVVTYSEPTAWADAFEPADFNALANNGGKLSTAAAVNNSTTRLLYAQVSFIMVTSTFSPTAGAHLAILLLPLLHDGTTYPENEDTTTAANLPPQYYVRGIIPVRYKAASTGSGMADRVQVPPGTWKWYVINRCGVALPSSSADMTCRYRLFGEEVA